MLMSVIFKRLAFASASLCYVKFVFLKYTTNCQNKYMEKVVSFGFPKVA